MKSSAKAKSFHVAVGGNFRAARDLAEPNTYDSSPQAKEEKRDQSESSINHQRTTYQSP